MVCGYLERVPNLRPAAHSFPVKTIIWQMVASQLSAFSHFSLGNEHAPATPRRRDKAGNRRGPCGERNPEHDLCPRLHERNFDQR